MRGRCVVCAGTWIGVGGETTSTADLGVLAGMSESAVTEDVRDKLEGPRRGMRGSGEPALFECREKDKVVDMTGDSTVAWGRLAMELIRGQRAG